MKTETIESTTAPEIASDQRLVRPWREGYPYQVWHDKSTGHKNMGRVCYGHCATLEEAEKWAKILRRYKIQGSRRNYYGRVTIRRRPNAQEMRAGSEGGSENGKS